MNTRNKRIIEGVRTFSPLLQAYEAGYSKEHIKDEIFKTLVPEFENLAVLDRYGIDLLAVESINIAKIRTSSWAPELYDASMHIRRKLLTSDKNLCAEICSQWEEPIGKALLLYWSTVKFENEKTDLPIDEYAYEMFRNIGSLIEGTLQTYLKELLHLAVFCKGGKTSYSEICSLSLGSVVNRLSDELGSTDIFTLKPWAVPLNQWRNIAQHYSIDTENSSVNCRYGTKNRHVIKLERKELMDVARELFLLYSAIRTSHTIFFLDSADTLVSHCKGFKRKDSDEQFQFCVGAASQGFEVIALNITEDKAYAQFTDVTEDDSVERALHASQFVYQLWKITKSNASIVKYGTKSGEKSLTAVAKAEDCERVFRGEKDFAYLMEVIEFEVN